MTTLITPKPHISDSAVQAVEKHCFSTSSEEVGGFLIGTVDNDGTHVCAALPAEGSRATQVSMTFTHESWERALAQISTQYPGLSIVGWYHSHPGFGLFLSSHDAFIQQNFFNGAGQVALVVDPVAASMGWFYYDGAEVRRIAESGTLTPALRKADDLDAGATARRSRGALAAAALSAAVVGLVGGWLLGVGQNQDVIADLDQQVATLSAQAEPPVVTDAPAASEQTAVAYTVQPGDTLTRIAQGWYGDAGAVRIIVRANPAIAPDELAVGQTLQLPLPKERS